MRTVGVVVVTVVCCIACSKKSNDAPSGDPAPKVSVGPKGHTERWGASLVAGANIKDFVVSFAKTDDTWTGALEGLTKTPLPLADVAVAPDHLAFTLQKAGAPESTWEHYTLQRKGGDASGTLTIGAVTLVIKMVQLTDGEAPRSAYPRPQTPKPPFPYEAREVTVDAPDGGKLAGTLTFPKGGAPAPAVLLWSGSGQQDRDETIYQHKPYLIVSDHLTRAGFAVLRLDDRGTGKTTGAVGTLDTEIADAGAAFEFLKAQKEVDPRRVGIIGHSTGGMVAPNVAVTHPVAFIVSLAGVAVSGRELVPLQLEAAARATGVVAPAEQLALQKKIGDATLEGPDAVKRALVEAVVPQMEKAMGRKPTQQEIDQAIAKPLSDATQPWTLSFFKIDPREAWKKLTIPVLLVVGDLDTQVPADVTIQALESSHGKREVVTTKKLPGLNHLFQHAKTGMPDEYVEISESFDPAALDVITSWLAATAK